MAKIPFDIRHKRVTTITGSEGIFVDVDGDDVPQRITVDDIRPIVLANGIPWGDITGTLSNQTDLQNALNTKVGTTGNESISGQKTFTNNAIINDNSTNPALTINQIGSGHSILVEDSASPDSTPFVVDNAGNVGIGTTAPSQKLEVNGNTLSTIYYLPDTAKFISGGVGAVMTISSGTNSMVFKQTANAFMRGTTGGLGIEITGTPTIDASAILTLTSTTKGFLPPRMTTAQRDAITPVAGLMIYNTTTNKHQGYNGTTWNDFY